MIGVIRRYKVVAALTGIVALTLGLTAATTTTPSSQPASPNAQYLAQWGMHVQPLAQSQTISESHALEAVHTSFPGLSTSRPMAAELVLFSNSVMTGLSTPQPAWIFTWNQVTYAGPQSRSSVAAPPVIFHHMNEVVSAKTGVGLMIFSSP